MSRAETELKAAKQARAAHARTRIAAAKAKREKLKAAKQARAAHARSVRSAKKTRTYADTVFDLQDAVNMCYTSTSLWFEDIKITAITGHARLNNGGTVLKLTLVNDKGEDDERASLAWVPEPTLQTEDAGAVNHYWESLPGGRDYQLGYMHQWAANRRLGRDEQHSVKWEIFRVLDCQGLCITKPLGGGAYSAADDPTFEPMTKISIW
ncbi:hypothetical protein LY76DRAFT_638361 [Colletotrichum caudatum]|nr:hypothetical protein LY76DRAFT_638361 [Colletotrichum caudatum]